MLAFEYAKKHSIKAIQIVSPRVRTHPKGVKRIEIGKTYGDESNHFINQIDAFIRIGGGPQSHKELKKFIQTKGADAPVIEYDIPLIK